MQIFLYLLSLIYSLLSGLRNLLFDFGILKTYKSKLKVICVGNLAVGGSGKSPVCQHIVKSLRDHKRVAVLSRGYGGSVSGPHLVTESDAAKSVGDEAIMHFRAFNGEIPVVVSKKRVEGAKFIEEQKLADIIVMDDGFQHRYLERDLNLLLFDISSEKTIRDLENNNLLPYGVLRESKFAAFKRADVIIGVSRTGADEGIRNLIPEDIQYCDASLVPNNFYDVQEDLAVGLEELQFAEGSAITAIAKPEAFFASLENLGISLVVKKFYRDHYVFSDADFADLEEPIFTTSKDLVKMQSLIDQGKKIFVLELGVEMVGTAFAEFRSYKHTFSDEDLVSDESED